MASKSQKIFERMPQAAKSGGWKSNDEQQIKEQKGVIWDLIKQLGQNISSGKSLISISLPVRIFEPRSYLERICDAWCYAPIFLSKAAAATDPIERLKYVITFSIAGLHNTCKQLKPFNPILGETFQARFEDQTEIYCEQESHHPPVTGWQLIGPNNSYHFHGAGEWTASFSPPNSIRGHQKGIHYVAFPDGGLITYNIPEIIISGWVMGDRIVEYKGTMKFRDDRNNLSCDIEVGNTGGFFSGFWSKKPPSDYFSGVITRGGSAYSEGEQISVVEGSWLGCVEFDGTPYWDFRQELPKSVPLPASNPLPSDCRFREDLIYLKQGDLEKAAEWKAKLENIQRADAKLRKEGYARRASH